MKINRPLDQLFANEARIQILRTLFKFPGEFTGRHIARLSNLPHATARLNLKVLEESDILNVKYAGKSKLYSLNKDNIMYKPLASLFEAEESVMNKLQAKLVSALQSYQDIRNQLVHASLYGSIAKGDERSDSDIDILLLFKHHVDDSRIYEVFEPLKEEIFKHYGNELHITNFCWDRHDKQCRLPKLSFLHEVASTGTTLYGDDLEEVLERWQKEQKQRKRSQAKRATAGTHLQLPKILSLKRNMRYQACPCLFANSHYGRKVSEDVSCLFK